MPKVPLTAEHKESRFTEYPKLSLEHGERTLLVCIEPEPTVEFKHPLRAPQIGPDGKVLKEEKLNAKGDPYESTVTEFIGQHLCFGDFNVLSDKGLDPENCPTCRAAEEEEGIDPPMKHYAMHVIKYSTAPGSWTLRDPFNVELLAWVFSQTRLNQIIDIAEEFGDLRQHDLKLGPCENAKYQKYAINVAASAQWLSGENEEEVARRKQIVAQTYKNNQCEDLSTLIARRISKADALSDVQKVTERMAQIYHRTNTSVPDLSALKKDTPAAGLDLFAPDTPGEKAAGENFKVDKTTGEVTGDGPDEAQAELKSLDFESIMADL